MDREPVAIPGELSVERALDEYFLRYRWPWFPVVDAAHHFHGLLVREARRRRPRGLPRDLPRLRPDRSARAAPPSRSATTPRSTPCSATQPAPLRRPDGGRRQRPPRRHNHRRPGRPRPPRRLTSPTGRLSSGREPSAVALVGAMDEQRRLPAWARELARAWRRGSTGSSRPGSCGRWAITRRIARAVGSGGCSGSIEGVYAVGHNDLDWHGRLPGGGSGAADRRCASHWSAGVALGICFDTRP